MRKRIVFWVPIMLAVSMFAFGFTSEAKAEEISALEQGFEQKDAVFVSEGIVPYANTTDYSYNFDLQPKGDTGGTAYHRKDNSTSVYVSIESHSGVHRMFVDGAHDTNGYGVKDCTATLYRARYNGQYRMRNFVNEWGYGFARLTAWAETTPGFVKGKWSPDSSKTWPEMGD